MTQRFDARQICVSVVLALAYPTVAFAATPRLDGRHPGDYLTARAGAEHVVAPASLYRALAAVKAKIPAFSRQTGLACSQCHYQFPQLTPFGRMFKLNGYTLTGLTPITQPGDTVRGGSLNLLPIPPVAVMAVVSGTHTAKALPGTQNNTLAMPQEFSLFLAGEITPRIGAFTQLTYSGADGSVGIDMVDIRYANHATVANKDLLYGFTLHNTPTAQDVWNTVPAWSYPFMASEASPSPIAATLIDGGLEQQVVGFGAYSLFNQAFYAELTAYRSAPQGVSVPLDSSAENTTKGVIPYWRAGFQHAGPSTYWMVGTYGFSARLYPTGVTGPTNRYTDAGFDAQVEQKAGASTLIGRATYIHESQTLDATFGAGESQNVKNNLSTSRASVSFLPSFRWGTTLGFFQTSGTRDVTLFAPGDVTGSRTGRPNTSGLVGEVQYNAWQNTRLGLQYVAYTKFNGSSSSYDVPGGRSASDNNTLFLYTWLAF
jgi:hypothetical protein